MYEHVDYVLKGTSPTIIHSGRLANPLDPLRKLSKEVSDRKNKTDQDIELLADLDWLGSFYPSEPGNVEIKNNQLSFVGFGVPNWPGDNIESMLIAAAKVQRLGTQFKAGIMCDGVFILRFGEQKTIGELFRDPQYRDTRAVRVKTSTVMRSRPIFHDWSLQIRVSYLKSVVNKAQIDQAVEIAGVRIGLSDHRPKYGRFTVS
jgi:hypothetical protein